MKVSGFTFVRNGLQLGYPFLESVQSLLPLVDELIINVPESSDQTLEAIQSLSSDKLHAFTSDWDDSLREGGKILSLQTNRALEKCSGAWAIYLQADEVLHEEDYDNIRLSINEAEKDKSIDGISFRYRHFEGDYWHVNPLRYRSQVRIIRTGRNIISWGDACGFKFVDGTNVRSLRTNNRVFHYGWARPPRKMLEKNRELEKLYHDDSYIENKYAEKSEHSYDHMDVCLPFKESHPGIMQELINNAEKQDYSNSTPYFLRLKVWQWLLKKWGILRP